MKRTALCLALVGLVFSSLPAVGQSGSSETYRQLQLFGDVFERVRSDYVEEVTDESLIEKAINGMLTSLDPHSGYLNAKSYRDMQVQTKGEFGGLGIEVTMENGVVKVVSPIDDTPAFRAGVKAGDFITRIDGQQVLGLTLTEAVEKMRGAVNTSIALTISRPGQERPFDISITRAVIKINSVRSRIEGDAAYVRITSFNEQTESGLKKAMAKLKKDLGDEMRGVVLDLRNNPGGLLEQAVAVADAFLDQGEIVSTRGRSPDDVQRFSARGGDMSDGKPIVVLINGGSASASEIVAGALQDHRRALVLGTNSFGKGSVQTIIPMAGHGAMRLTTSRYYTPSGRSIQATGIEPDIEIVQSRVEPIDAGPQRTEASLQNALQSEKNGEDQSGDATTPGAGPTGTAEDYQLVRALDLLRGITLYGRGFN